jgi:hypothetical protein
MPEKKKEKNNSMREQKSEPKSKSKPKHKVVPKAKTKEKQKPKSLPKVLPKAKAGESNGNKVIVEIEQQEPQRSEEMYNSKLKSLLNKIKSQNQYSDNGIRFAWRN